MSVTFLRKPALLVAAAAAIAVSFAPVSASAATSTFGYTGTAFGTSITAAGGAVVSGRTALVTYGCGTPAGLSKQATSAALTVPPLLSTGTTVSTGETSASPVFSRTSSTVQNVNLLAGAVTASAVKSVATASNNGTSYAVSAAGTTFTSLSVLGLPIAVNVAPNTRITLPGVGYVIINQQVKSVTSSSASITVNAIHVVVNTANLLGFPVGTNILVASAKAGLTAPTGGFLGGFAYGTQVQAAGVLSSSRSFLQPLPCAGTNGVVLENVGVGINLPSVLSTGTIRDTAQGSTTATTAFGETTSTIQSANLLNGLVTATGIRAVATVNRANGVTTKSDSGSTFATITVGGVPLVVANIAPNSTMPLAGVGTLYLHRVIKTATSIEVRMIEIRVLQGNVFGLPIGTVITVAVAKASAS